MHNLIRKVGTALFLFVLTTGAALADVRCVQDFLSRTAFDPGPVDGLWGGKTATALEEAFDQLGREVEGGVGRDNTDHLCTIFTGPEADEIADLLAYRFYPVTISSGGGGIGGPTAFDFAGVDIAEEFDATGCRFEIWRHIFNEDNANIMMASGAMNVSAGRITVTQSSWRVGGFSDPRDLIEHSNLALNEDGEVVGRMIYYERWIEPGEVFEPPIYVTLPAHFEKVDGPLSNGQTYFEANSWSEGSLRLVCPD